MVVRGGGGVFDKGGYGMDRAWRLSEGTILQNEDWRGSCIQAHLVLDTVLAGWRLHSRPSYRLWAHGLQVWGETHLDLKTLYRTQMIPHFIHPLTEDTIPTKYYAAYK